MPLSTYFPPANLVVDQVVAGSYGHVRYETAGTFYYPPNVHVVASWDTTEIFTTGRDFYSVVCGLYTNGLSPVVSGVATHSTFISSPFNFAGLGPKRVSFTVDQNGGTGQDSYVSTAGFVSMVGVAVKTRDASMSSWISAQGQIRQESSVVSRMLFLSSGLVELDSGVTATAVSFSSNLPTTQGFFAGQPTAITFSCSQSSNNNVVVTVPFRRAAASGNAPGLILPWNQSASPDSESYDMYMVSVMSGASTVVSTMINSLSHVVTAGAGGFVVNIPSSSILTGGSYTIRVSEKRPLLYATVPSGFALDTYAVVCQGVSTVSVSTTLTLAGFDSSLPSEGGNAVVSTEFIVNVPAQLAADWVMQDLQVNLRTRVVTSSLASVRLKPGDHAVLGIVFHNGTYVVDPGASNVRLGVRDASNSSPYYFYNTSTTVVSVGQGSYYRMEILANDEDLLAGQAASLLAGSNTAQSLVGEIQWTTTRGTFSSNSFTINAPNEVVREPDV